MNYPPSYLECQTCGDRMRKLHAHEAAEVAANPYNYIRYCSTSCALMDADATFVDLDEIKRELESRGGRG